MSIYLMCLILFTLGLYCILRKRNIMKMIIGVILSEYAVNLLFIAVAYRMEGRAPIFAPDQTILSMVDALPQAVVLTSIAVGLATTVTLIALAIRIYEKYGTFDITRIKELKG